MTIQEIKNYYNTISILIQQRALLEAIDNLKQYCQEVSVMKYNDSIDTLETSYRYMIQYLSEGTIDPEQKNVYNKLVLSLYSLNDNIFRSAMLNIDSSLYYNTLRFIQNSKFTLPILYNKYRSANSELNVLEMLPENERDINRINFTKIHCEEIEGDIFKQIWTSSNNVEDTEIIAIILNDSNIALHFRELILNALLLSCINIFDENKVNLIIDLYDNSTSSILQAKAITALFILSSRHKDKFELSSRISDRIRVLSDNSNFETDIKAVILQLIKTRDTERITRKMRDELLPELMKLNPKVYSKIKDLDKNLIEEELEGNPDWKNILEDSGITKKIQEMNEIQLEGGDVFMSTFSHLKNFPFFNNINNWFLPFHKNHSLVSSSGINNKIFTIIENSNFLCNSDKYSFTLALNNVPDAQKQMMASQFESQNIDLNELKSSELTTEDKTRENCILRYVQDLYRFFKLFPRKSEFYDPFTDSQNIKSNYLTKSIFSDTESLNIIAEFYFKREYYNEAIKILSIITRYDNLRSEIYQKLGFCHQNLRNYKSAVEQYKKADIIEPRNTWTYRHIAMCNKALGEIDEAIKYYKYAENVAPDNIGILLNIGHLLLEKDNIDDALKYYYKVDYLCGDSHKAWRPIAWSEFVNKNYSQSENYYAKIEQDSPTAQDFLNMGHVALSQRKIAKAIEFYIKCLTKCNNNFKEFEKLISSDRSVLLEQGINADEIPLILDVVKYKSNAI